MIFKDSSDYENTKLRVVDSNSGKTELTLPVNFNIIAINKDESIFLIEHNGKYFIYKNQHVLQEAIKSIIASKNLDDIEYLKRVIQENETSFRKHIDKDELTEIIGH